MITSLHVLTTTQVIEEVGSSRYRSALHSKTFDSAVKKFRERENAEAKRLSAKTTPRVPRAHSDSSLDDALHSAKEAAQRELEGLPRQIIQQARTFHDHVHFFVNSGAGVAEEAATQKNTTVPKELRELLDELAEVEDLGERVKQEIMEDDDTRNVSTLSPLTHLHAANVALEDFTNAEHRTYVRFPRFNYHSYPHR